MKKILSALGLALGFHLSAFAGLSEGLAAIKAKDYTTGLQQLAPLAEEGNSEAQHNLARLYAYGLGTPKDVSKALYWYTKAAQQGYAPAQFGLGLIYVNGDGIPKDDAEAVRWWRMAADQSNARALHALAIMYAGGHGVPQDYARAVELYGKAIENGSTPSFYNLGVIYANGAAGIAKNLPMAYVVFSLGVASDVNCQGYRGIVAAQLQPEQIRKADKLIKAWVPGTDLPRM